MSVYKPKGSPYYHFDFQIRGRRHHGTTGLESRREAEQFERQERKKAALASASGRRQDMTLNAASARFYQEVSVFQKSEGTQLYQLENLCARLGKHAFLDAISDNEVADYICRRRSDPVAGGKLISNASVNREVQLLRRVMRRADKTWKTNVGDMPDWTSHRLPEAQGRTRELSGEEEAALFKHLRVDLRPLARFCILSGARLGSAVGLTWADLDFQDALIRLRVKTHRLGADVHQVPMTGALRALLSSLRGQHPIQVFTYVCKKSRGGRKKGERYPFSKNGWRKDWKAALEAAGIEDLRFHDMRHTAASRTLRKSRNIKAVQQMLGHADLASTSRYAHVVMDDVRAAMEDTHSRNSPEQVSATDGKSLKGEA